MPVFVAEIASDDSLLFARRSSSSAGKAMRKAPLSVLEFEWIERLGKAGLAADDIKDK